MSDVTLIIRFPAELPDQEERLTFIIPEKAIADIFRSAEFNPVLDEDAHYYAGIIGERIQEVRKEMIRFQIAGGRTDAL